MLDLLVGDDVILNDSNSLKISFGDIGILLSGGCRGVVLKIENCKVIVGFKLNEYITITALVDPSILKKLK